MTIQDPLQRLIDRSAIEDAIATYARALDRMDEKLLRACRTVAEHAARTLGCRDVARVDLRLDSEGFPWVIEVSPLPGLTPSYSDIVMIAEASGMSYRDLIARILESAVARVAAKRKKPPTAGPTVPPASLS